MLDETWIRWVAIVELLLLVMAGVYWLFGMRTHMPTPMFAIGMAYGSVLVAFSLVVVLNMMAHVPATPGLVIGVALVAPPVGFVLWETGRAINRANRD